MDGNQPTRVSCEGVEDDEKDDIAAADAADDDAEAAAGVVELEAKVTPAAGRPCPASASSTPSTST